MTNSDMKRFRQLVRSRLRGLVAQTKEPPPLMLYTSAGARANKALAFHVGAATSAAEVAANVRKVILERRPAYAAISATTHTKGTDERSRGVAFVLAARTGETETWQTEYRAGALEPWELGEFDPGSTLDLLRSSWAELARVEALEELVGRLRAIGERELPEVATEEELALALARREKVGELGEGLMSFLGEPGARAPRESERDFTAYVERWVSDVEEENADV